jgi:uncharacterized Zn-binding protein involved in type VI secretion
VPADAHGCIACPHVCTGPATSGSHDVMVNGLPATRVTDTGVHAVCCAPVPFWTAKTGSSIVKINGLDAHREGDVDLHCGGIGSMIEGSDTVMTGG